MADWSKYATGGTVPNNPADDVPAVDPAAPKTDWAQYEVKSAPAAAPAAAAAPPKSLLHQILDYAVNNNPAIGAIEDVGQAATGAMSRVPAGLAGLVHAGTNAAGITGGNPADTVAGVEHALTYQPRTNAGQAGDQMMADTANAGSRILAPVDRALGGAADATGHGPLIRSAVPAIADALTNVLPLTKGLGAGANAAESVIGTPSDANPLATARAAGYKTTPSNAAIRNPTQQPGTLDSVIGKVGNSTATKTNNVENTALSTQLAGQQMGLGDNVTKITIPDLAKAKVAPGTVYDTTGAQVGDFKPSGTLSNSLANIVSDPSVQTPAGARTAAKKILDGIAANSGNYNGTDMVGDISALRESPATRPVANLLENEIETQLAKPRPVQNPDGTPKLDQHGNPVMDMPQQGVMDLYRAARQKFAQILTVQDSLKGGQVDSQMIGKVHADNPNLLTGNLRLIGTAANELPADVRLPSEAEPSTLSSILSAPVRALAAGSARRVGNALAPVANDAGRSYFPTFGERPAPPSQPLTLTRPEGRVGDVTPVQGGMALPEGPGSVSGAPMSDAASNQLVRPLGEAFQPHQPDLFPPNNVSTPKGPAPKVSKPSGISDSDWKLLQSLGLGD